LLFRSNSPLVAISTELFFSCEIFVYIVHFRYDDYRITNYMGTLIYERVNCWIFCRFYRSSIRMERFRTCYTVSCTTKYDYSTNLYISEYSECTFCDYLMEKIMAKKQ